jgi:hypothetical protein
MAAILAMKIIKVAQRCKGGINRIIFIYDFGDKYGNYSSSKLS